ncbi:MAG: D-aminoacylase [Chlorobi bacterium]|nr:D-aminoacylase [Chlorobiota bacterium]
MKSFRQIVFLLPVLLGFLFSCSSPDYDVIIRNGMIYDGSGGTPYKADLAISGDTIAAIGDLGNKKGVQEMDASGLAVAPGFINMLSWATESLIQDGRSQSDIRQGVTLEVMGEGSSMGPLNEKMKKEMVEDQDDIKYNVPWTTLDGYLRFLEKKGISPNVASFIGQGSVREYVIGLNNRPATPEEMEQMKSLVRQAMEEGAVGMASALIYIPGTFASTGELIELAKVVAEYDGLYISHIRHENDHLLQAVDELIRIARESGCRSEIYHFKAGGRKNWTKLDTAIKKIEQARKEGLRITADMYNYPASATGLNTVEPTWAREGGHDVEVGRIKDPETRKKILDKIKFPCSPDSILLVGFANDSLKYLTGKSLAEVARLRGTSLKNTVLDLIVDDDSRIGTVFFTMSEDNIRKKIALPWMSFCSDAGSLAPEGVFLKTNPHPRAYGSFARLLGKYVREEKVIPLKEAVRRLTSFPASNLKLYKRGSLKPGYYADVVVFDPEKIADKATFTSPHQYAVGMVDVFVNGQQVLKDGKHTGALPGRVVRGPGTGVRPR